jgi:hypothetical protein
MGLAFVSQYLSLCLAAKIRHEDEKDAFAGKDVELRMVQEYARSSTKPSTRLTLRHDHSMTNCSSEHVVDRLKSYIALHGQTEGSKQ